MAENEKSEQVQIQEPATTATPEEDIQAVLPKPKAKKDSGYPAPCQGKEVEIQIIKDPITALKLTKAAAVPTGSGMVEANKGDFIVVSGQMGYQKTYAVVKAADAIEV